MTHPEFSVIIPVYNSAIFLKALTKDIADLFLSINRTYEIILVNDSSADNSLPVMQELKKENSLVNAVDLKKNVGQYAATLVGLSLAKGNYLITIDADFCPPPFHIKTLIENIRPGDMLIYGELGGIERNSFRNIGSTIFNTLIIACLNKKVDGTGSSFRLVSKTLADKVLSGIREPLLLDIKLINAAPHVAFIPISVNKAYQSSYSISKLIMGVLSLLTGIFLERFYFRKTFAPQELINKS